MVVADVSTLVSKIISRRAVLDMRFSEDIRQMRKRYGDQATNEALAEANRQREALSAKGSDQAK